MRRFLRKLIRASYFLPIPITILIGIIIFMLPIGELKFLGVFFILLTPIYLSIRRRARYPRYESDKEEYVNKDIDKVKDFNKDKKYYEDLKACEDILKKIKNYSNDKNINIYLKKTYSILQEEFEKAKKISEKIDLIDDILTSPYWNIDKINQRIQKESENNPNDTTRLAKLNEMKEHILKLKEKETKLNNHISDLSLNFHTIFTKITLLDNEEKVNFDEIETEIQKILDYKLKVSEYEEKLDDELKEFKTNY